MKKIISIAFCVAICLVFAKAEAKTFFLPDWQGAGMETKRFDGNANKDEPLCRQSGLYHKADGCPAPKIFDEYCPFSNKWISECYCPPLVFTEVCVSPYKGDVRETDSNGYANCDNLWVACCDTTCPAGTSLDNTPGCDGYELNDCGDRCYYPYRAPLEDETGCSYGTEDCSDNCGGTRQCCKACVPTASVDASSCDYGTTTCDDGCGGTRTCCDTCTPIASVDTSTCDYGTTTCDDGCGGSRTCCAGCSPTLTAVDASSCDYGTKQVDNGCGTNVTQCKTCADNGGSSSCSGQTTACGTNQTETSSCTDCNGTTRYTCEDNEEDCTYYGYKSSNDTTMACAEVEPRTGLTCYSCLKKTFKITNCLDIKIYGHDSIADGSTISAFGGFEQTSVQANGTYYLHNYNTTVNCANCPYEMNCISENITIDDRKVKMQVLPYQSDLTVGTYYYKCELDYSTSGGLSLTQSSEYGAYMIYEYDITDDATFTLIYNCQYDADGL